MHVRILMLSLSMLLGMSLPVQATPIVTIGSATVISLDTFTIHFSISDAVDLASWQFDLAFNPAILEVTAASVSESAFFTQGDITVFVPGVVDNAQGAVLGASDALIFQAPVNGSGMLGFVEFKAIGTGVSSLTLSNVFLNLLDSGFSASNGSVCVNAPTAPTCQPHTVPEPGTLALVAIGCWFAGLTTKRRMRHSTPA